MEAMIKAAPRQAPIKMLCTWLPGAPMTTLTQHHSPPHPSQVDYRHARSQSIAPDLTLGQDSSASIEKQHVEKEERKADQRD